jgi:hypothetical protein
MNLPVAGEKLKETLLSHDFRPFLVSYICSFSVSKSKQQVFTLVLVWES